MSARNLKESVLFRTSSASDVKCSGGIISIAGLKTTTPKNSVISITQQKYKAEVLQVVTVAGTSYTPTPNTKYAVWVYDPLRTQAGYSESPKPYSMTTFSDLSLYGTPTQQREAIHVALVADINNDLTNHATAATLGGGTGFTVTDNSPYNPVWSQTMTNVKGPNTVIPITNGDGTGFAKTNYSVTTPAVFSVGVGAKLAQEVPVVDAVYGNLISGVLVSPPLTAAGLPAVSGQNYDVFVINSLELSNAVGITDQYLYQMKSQYIFVDNGTGSSTANLAGFIAFERAMIRLIGGLYAQDPSAIVFTTDNKPVCQGLNTGLPSGTSLAENVISFGNGQSTHYYPLGTNTLVALTATASGIGCVLDATDGEGVELSAPTWSTSSKNAVVGQTAFSIFAQINIDDVSGLNPMWVGFRKQAAANATYTAYTDYALIGLGDAAGNIFTSTELNGGGNTNTDTTQNWADGETHELEVKVAIDGTVTFFIDGYKPTVTQTFTFDAGDTLIPVFCYALQATDLGTPSVSEGLFVTGESWRS